MVILKNLSSNLTEVTIGSLKVWFSYETPIAIQIPQKYTFILVTKEKFTQTTAKHIKKLKERFELNFEVYCDVTVEEFQRALNDLDSIIKLIA